MMYDNKRPTSMQSVSRPPLLKNTSVTVDGYPRISRRLKMKHLRAEAVARGENLETIPNNKADLLRFLVDGSIQLSATPEWKALLEIKEVMEEEKALLNDRNEQTYRDILAREEAIRAARALDEEDKRKQKEYKEHRKIISARMRARHLEIEAQLKLHNLDFPSVHPCKLARSEELSHHGSMPRDRNCSVCESFVGSYTCEKCDFDICKACFDKKNGPSPEEVAKEREEQEKTRLLAQWRAARRRREAEEASERAKYDINKFSMAVKKPSKPARNPKSNRGNGFTVWYSEGYRYESRHTKNFDTTWKTAERANERARFVFFWNNEARKPDDLVNGEDGVEETEMDGLVTYRGIIADQEWTVAVVPDRTFQQLQFSSEEPNDYFEL